MAAQSEGSPLQSKKFVAFLVSEMTWKIIMGLVMVVALKWDKVDPWVAGIVMALILVAGFVEAGYIIGQSSLDKFTRVAEIAAGAGKNFTSKSISMHDGAAPAAPVAPVPAVPTPEVAPAAPAVPPPVETKVEVPAAPEEVAPAEPAAPAADQEPANEQKVG